MIMSDASERKFSRLTLIYEAYFLSVSEGIEENQDKSQITDARHLQNAVQDPNHGINDAL